MRHTVILSICLEPTVTRDDDVEAAASALIEQENQDVPEISMDVDESRGIVQVTMLIAEQDPEQAAAVGRVTLNRGLLAAVWPGQLAYNIRAEPHR